MPYTKLCFEKDSWPRWYEVQVVEGNVTDYVDLFNSLMGNDTPNDPMTRVMLSDGSLQLVQPGDVYDSIPSDVEDAE